MFLLVEIPIFQDNFSLQYSDFLLIESLTPTKREELNGLTLITIDVIREKLLLFLLPSLYINHSVSSD